MIKNALIAIETALKTIDEIKYINENWGQLEFYAQPPVSWPCVLLECSTVNYSSLGRNAQRIHATIAVHIADYRNLEQPNARIDIQERYTMFDLLSAIDRQLQGLSGATFSPLVREGTTRQRRDDGIREFITTFSFSYTDTTAVKSTQHIVVPVKIDPVIKKATR